MIDILTRAKEIILSGQRRGLCTSTGLAAKELGLPVSYDLVCKVQTSLDYERNGRTLQPVYLEHWILEVYGHTLTEDQAIMCRLAWLDKLILQEQKREALALVRLKVEAAADSFSGYICCNLSDVGKERPDLAQACADLRQHVQNEIYAQGYTLWAFIRRQHSHALTEDQVNLCRLAWIDKMIADHA